MGQKKMAPAVAAAKGHGAKTEQHNARIKRYGKAKQRSNKMADFLAEVEPSRGHKVGRCASWLLFHNYYQIKEYRLVKAYFCKQHLLCTPCAIRRSGKLLSQFLPKYHHVMAQNPALKTYMVTLTVKNGVDLMERFTHLQSAVKTLQKRRRNTKQRGDTGSEWSNVLGAVGSYEVTFNAKTKEWHPHCHIIVLADGILSQYRLKGEWFKITGDSHQVNVQKIKNPDEPEKDFVEVFKYNLKFSDLPLYENFLVFHHMRGKNLLFSTGLLRGVKVPEDLTDDPLLDQPYIEMMYRYFNDNGYQLLQNSEGGDKHLKKIA